MFIILGLITSAASVGGCVVHPASVVITAGESALLTCSTTEGAAITSWYMPIDLLHKTNVYAAPLFKSDGTIRSPEKLAKGYFVTRPADNETTLHMNKTTLSQAGLYICTCTCELPSAAAATVVVLDSEPKFATDPSVAHIDGKSVTLRCSMSFNASSDVLCELKIEDSLGSTVKRRNGSIVNNGLIVCNLRHIIIANASSDQWYTCNVTLITKGDAIIYSRVLNATVEWESISSTADFLSSVDLPHEERDEETSKTLAIGLSVTIFAVIIPIAVVIYFIMRSKIRSKRFPGQQPQHGIGQPHDPSSNCQQRPANRYDKNKIGYPTPEVPAKSCHDAAQHDNKSLTAIELILCENELYAETPKQLDPSDGYYAEEVIYNEIK